MFLIYFIFLCPPLLSSFLWSFKYNFLKNKQILRNFLLCNFIYSPLLSSLIDPNVVLNIAFPDIFLTPVIQPVSTLLVIISYEYLLFLSYITTYLTKFSYVTNVRQLISSKVVSLFQWGLVKKKANGNRSGTSNSPVIVRHCLELQRLLQATNHLLCAGQDNRYNQELPCCLQKIIFLYTKSQCLNCTKWFLLSIFFH